MVGKKQFLSAIILASSLIVGVAHGMKEENPFESMNSQLELQNYPIILKSLDYELRSSRNPLAVDWLLKAAFEQFHVPLIYTYFREVIESSKPTSVLNSKQVKLLNCWMIIALVLGKADVDCCHIYSHLDVDAKKTGINSYDALRRNYMRLMKDRSSYKLSYVDIIKQARELFTAKICDEDGLRTALPLPVWVCFTTERQSSLLNLTFSTGVDFNMPSEHRRSSYLEEHMITGVKKHREESFEKTWLMFEKCNDWNDFFNLTAYGIDTFVIPKEGDMQEDLADTPNQEPRIGSEVSDQRSDSVSGDMQQGKDQQPPAQDLIDLSQHDSSTSSASQQNQDTPKNDPLVDQVTKEVEQIQLDEKKGEDKEEEKQN